MTSSPSWIEVAWPDAHVAGHSLGSAIALAVATSEPGRVASLSLHSTWAATSTAPHIRAWLEARQATAAANNPDIWMRYAFFLVSPQHFARHGFTSGALGDVAELIRRLGTGSHVGQYDAGLAHDAADQLDSLRLPTLVTVGESDFVTLPEYGRSLADAVRGGGVRGASGRGSHGVARTSGFVQRDPAALHPARLLMSEPSVEIAGGGLAGLACAIAFAERGWRTRVWEQASTLRELGAGLYVWENGLRTLEALGVYDELLPTSHPVHRFDVRDEWARTVESFNYSHEPGDRLTTMLRPLLHSALVRRAEQLGAEIVTGARAISASPAGRTHLRGTATPSRPISSSAPTAFTRKSATRSDSYARSGSCATAPPGC